MPLTAAIAQTPPLANGAHRAFDDRAPELTQGATVTGLNVRQSERELKRRKVLQETGAATVDEVSASQVRMVAVEMAAAFETHGTALRGGPITQADLDNVVDNLGSRMTALMVAERARRYNAKVMENPEPLRSTSALRRLPKVTPGLKPGGNIAVAANPRVGDRCPDALFPQNYAALDALTGAQIDDLQTWYNEDFDIVATDDINARRSKFRDFVQW